MSKYRETGPSGRLDEKARELMKHLELLANSYLYTEKTAQLSRTETTLLRYLSCQGARSMSDVASGIGMALSSATGLVDRLVEKKLVRRNRSEDDRRSVVVELTARWRKMHDSFVGNRSALGLGMLEPLEEKERELLLSLFVKMTEPLRDPEK